MREMVPCHQCGGQREHDLRTGEVLPCDVCGERLCDACKAGNHWGCVGHYCECRECALTAGRHMVCPPCGAGRHGDCLGHRCHCPHFSWHDPSCRECREAMRFCICGIMHNMSDACRASRWEWECPAHGRRSLDKGGTDAP